MPIKNTHILLGDFNAKVGDQHSVWPEVVDRYGLGEVNDRGLQLLQFCAINNLVISNTLFRHSKKRRATWVSTNGDVMNQIDYVNIQKKSKNIVKSSRAYHSAEIGSDHFPVLANLELRTRKPKITKTVPRRYDVDKLIGNREQAKYFEVQRGGGGCFCPSNRHGSRRYRNPLQCIQNSNKHYRKGS